MVDLTTKSWVKQEWPSLQGVRYYPTDGIYINILNELIDSMTQFVLNCFSTEILMEDKKKNTNTKILLRKQKTVYVKLFWPCAIRKAQREGLSHLLWHKDKQQFAWL